ncbi:MAG TPA: PH domain-containing protein [Bacillota bacterium]|nr:PH domain-containing protein [Bacillota bacterium]
MDSQIFQISPIISKGFSLSMIGFAILWLGVIALFVGIMVSAHNIQYAINPQGLTIKNAIFYGRTIRKDEIAIDGARIINLNEEPAYKPALRTNGIGLPGFQSGWFRLKNKEKALLFVTVYQKVLYLPTTKDYSLLISVTDPETMLEKMKEMWSQ